MKFLQMLKYKRKSTLLIFCLIFACSLVTVIAVQAQSTNNAAINNQIWTLWRKGFEDFQNAEHKMISRKYPDAIAHYTAALESFRKVRKLNPKWNKDVIEYRIGRAEQRIEVAKERIRRTLPATARKAISPGRSTSQQLTAVQTRQSAENTALRVQLDEAKKALTSARIQAASGQAAERQVRGLLAEKARLEKEIALLKLKYDNVEKLRLSKTREYDKMVIEEKAKSTGLSQVIQEQNRELIALKKQLQGVIYDKKSLDSRIKLMQKAMEEERIIASAQLKQAKDSTVAVQKELEKSRENALSKDKQLLNEKIANEELRGKITALQNSGNASNLAAKQTQSENASLRKRLEESAAELSALKKYRKLDEEKIAGLEKEIRKLQSDLAANIRQSNAYGSMNDSFVKKISELEKIIAVLKKDNAKLTEDYNTAARERSAFAAKINAGFPEAKKLEELIEQNKALALVEKQLKTKISAMEKRNGLTAAELKKSEEKILELRKKYADLDAQKSAADARLTALTSEKNALDRKLQTLEITSRREKAEAVLKEKNTAQKEIAKLKAVADQHKKAHDAMAAEVKNMPGLHAQIRTLTLERDMAQKALAVLQAKTKSEAEKKKIETAPVTANPEIIALNKKLKEAEKRIALLSENNDKSAKAEIIALNEKLKEAEKRIAILSANNDKSAKTEVIALNEKFKEAEKKIAILQEKADKLAAAEKMLAVLEGKSKSQDQLLKDIAALRERTEKLKEAEKRIAELEKTAQLLAVKEKELTVSYVKKEKLEEAELAIQKLQKEIAQLKTEMAKKTSVQETAEKIQDVKKTASELAAKLANSEELRKNLENEKLKHLESLQKYEKDTLKMMRDMEKLVAFRNQAILERSKLAEELKKMKLSGHAVDQKLMDAEKNYLKLQQKFEETSKKHDMELKKVIAEHNESIAALKKVNNEYLVAIGNANIAKEKAEKENIRLKEELEKTAEKAALALKYQADSHKLVTVEKELQNSRKNAGDLYAQLTLLRKNLAKLGKDNLTLQDKSEQLGKEYVKLAAERDQLKLKAAEAVSMRNLAAMRKNQLDDLNRELKERAEKEKKLESEYAKARQELARWRSADDPLITRLRELLGGVAGKTDDKDQGKLRDRVIDELILEISSERKKQRSAVAETIVAANEALRQKRFADDADDAAKVAKLEAVRVRSEMTILKKDIEDGKVATPSEDSYLAAEKAGDAAVTEAMAKLEKTMLPVSPVKIQLTKDTSLTVAAISSAVTGLNGEKDKSGEMEKAAEEKKDGETGDKTVAEKKDSGRDTETGQEDKKKVYHPDADVKKYESAMKAGKEAEEKGDYSMALWHYWQAADAGVQEAAPYMALAKLNIKRDEKPAAEKAYRTALKYGADRDEELEKIFEKEAEELPKVGEDSKEENKDEKSSAENKQETDKIE